MPLMYQRRSSGTMVLSSLLKLQYRLAALAVALSVITVVHGSDNQTGQDGDFRRQLTGMLDLLCPYDKTCRGGEPRLQLDKGMESCCTECSCEDSCGQTESCCFPEQATKSYFDRSHQQCERSSTTSLDRYRIAKEDFYMITSGYGNGSREDCGTGNLTCGENEAASALGSFYPVSSKSTKLIYKNEQCARCHGVARSDMIAWEVMMTCRQDDVRADTLLQLLEMGRVHATCWLDYNYPGPQSDVNAHRCYEHTIRSCRHYDWKSFKLPSYLNMTDDEVRAACLTGPQARFRRYYNLFCFLCRYLPYDEEQQCIRIGFGDRTSIGSLTALLDSRFLKNKAFTKRKDVETQVKFPIACKRYQVGYADCRPALCPSGTVRLDVDCVYITTTLAVSSFKVSIELYPGDHRNISPLIDHLVSNLQQGKDWKTVISAPRLGSWRLTNLCYHESPGFFWLELKLEKTKSSTLANILANVDTIMTGDWEFIVNRTSIRLDPRFSKLELVRSYHAPTGTFKPFYADNLDIQLGCAMADPTRSLSMYVTKLYFCDQVALQPEEFVIDTEYKRMYVNATGRMFSPTEFSLGYDTSGDPVPRLCLEDTDFVLMPQQNHASPSGAPAGNYWSILTLIATFMHIIKFNVFPVPVRYR